MARADTSFDSALFSLLNQDRTSNGVAPLRWNGTLGGIAENSPYGGCGYRINGRAQDMLDRSYFSHTIPNCGSRNVFAMMQAAGVPYQAAGENIGWESGVVDTSAAATYMNTMLMNSPEHKANILDPSFTDVGIGSAMTALGQSWSGAGDGVPYQEVTIASEVFGQLPPGIPGSDPSAVQGYWMVASDGGIFAFGNAPFAGSTGNIHLAQPVVGMAPTPGGRGYWLVASDGGIFAFGDAQFAGSTGAMRLNQPIVGMARTPDGAGYWLVASDGGIFSFGDAHFAGSTGAIHLNSPIVGMATTPTGQGYWLVAADGGIFAFGDAQFAGSAGSQHLTAPVIGLSASPSGHGYRIATADGSLFAYGDATSYGSMAGQPLNRPIVGLSGTPDGSGYRMVATDGGIFSFGNAPFYGSTGAIHLNQPIVGMASR